MTELTLKNKTEKESVITYITLGATAGCVQDVNKLVFSHGKKITKLNDLMGYFDLAPKEYLTIAAPDGEGFNGNISFNTPPLNCPTTDFPMGVNLAEFIINNGFQTNGQETVDISGVCGTNALIKFHLSADDWTTNGGAISVKNIENGLWKDNTGRNGVFPFGCDNCTSSNNPPECIGVQPEYVNTNPICTVQRPANANAGGKVEIEFFGTFNIA